MTPHADFASSNHSISLHQSPHFISIPANKFWRYLAFMGDQSRQLPYLPRPSEHDILPARSQDKLWKAASILHFKRPLLRANVDTSAGGSGTPREDSVCTASKEPGPSAGASIISRTGQLLMHDGPPAFAYFCSPRRTL